MSDIEDLQRRIISAMERISASAEKMGSGASAEALEEEKLANAQLRERLKALSDKHADEMAGLRAELEEIGDVARMRSEVEAHKAQVEQLDGDIQRLRRANEQLRASNAALREANEAGVGEPHLINKAMLAELEGLRASRAADAAEAAAILAQLEPMLASAGAPIEEAADA